MLMLSTGKPIVNQFMPLRKPRFFNKRGFSYVVSGTAVAGFTLLELLIVLVIMGMVAALVIPSLSSSQGAVLKAQAREVVAVLKYARRSAVVEGKQKTVVLSGGKEENANEENTNQSRPKRTPGHWVSRGGIALQWNNTVSDNDEVNDYDDTNGNDANNQAEHKITFYPEGGSSGGELTLSYLEYKAKISVNPLTGKIESDIFDNEPEN